MNKINCDVEVQKTVLCCTSTFRVSCRNTICIRGMQIVNKFDTDFGAESVPICVSNLSHVNILLMKFFQCDNPCCSANQQEATREMNNYIVAVRIYMWPYTTDLAESLTGFLLWLIGWFCTLVIAISQPLEETSVWIDMAFIGNKS